jgi:flagellar biosynthetic protein FlhB
MTLTSYVIEGHGAPTSMSGIGNVERNRSCRCARFKAWQKIRRQNRSPTPRRRQEAREQGNIARSPDLTAAVLLPRLLMLLKSFGPGLVQALKTLLERCSSPCATSTARPSERSFCAASARRAGSLAPMFIGVCILAIIINLLQSGCSSTPSVCSQT